jgi:hypothetical protein
MVKTKIGCPVGDGDVFDAVSFLKASLLKTRTWEAHDSSAVLLWCCYCLRLSFRSAMYDIVGNSKVSPFSVLAMSCHPPTDS